jgi:carbon-monoxide dehydrogenase large subunit
MIVHGQVHGGIVQGVGQALWEQYVYEPGSGQVLSGSFMDYAMPKADMVPFFDTELSEVPSPTHPLGIRPAGEGGTTPALGVVINAVVDAVSEFGVTHIEMPATPERVWRAIQNSPRRHGGHGDCRASEPSVLSVPPWFYLRASRLFLTASPSHW